MALRIPDIHQDMIVTIVRLPHSAYSLALYMNIPKVGGIFLLSSEIPDLVSFSSNVNFLHLINFVPACISISKPPPDTADLLLSITSIEL